MRALFADKRSHAAQLWSSQTLVKDMASRLVCVNVASCFARFAAAIQDRQGLEDCGVMHLDRS